MQGRVAAAALLAAVALLGAGALGCAVTPTGVTATVWAADTNTPAPLLLLRTTLATTGDPPLSSSTEIRSLVLGDASDRPDPFGWPLVLPLAATDDFAGAVTVTIEGLDWDTHAVIARGSAAAEVVPGKRTSTTVIMMAVPAAAP